MPAEKKRVIKNLEHRRSHSIVVLSEHEEFSGEQMVVLILKEDRRTFQIVVGNITAVFENFF